jgi:hypothetical protein
MEQHVRSLRHNAYVKVPSEMPIRLALQCSDVHITQWSASVYDAMFEEVKSIVTSEEGRDYFIDMIDDGSVVYCSTVDSVVSKVSDMCL